MLKSRVVPLLRSPVFVVSKLFWLVANPAVVILAGSVIGALMLWSRRWCVLGRVLVTVSAGLFAAITLLPIGAFALATLEDRFPRAEPPARVDGIVLLSGYMSVGTGADRGTVELNAMADRMTGFLALARRYPDARLVFTGGSAALLGDQPTEAEGARRLFAEIGAPVERIAFEDRARNTAENASYAFELAAPAPGETWLLVTSAFHMPRAVACFRAAGWDVVPYPVDYMTGGLAEITIGLDPLGGLNAFNLAMHEVAGLIAYRLLGYTDTLWPAP